MSNLLEKALLTGFGIFLLTTFLSLLTPFLGIIANFNNNKRDDLYSYSRFIDEFDCAIQEVIIDPELNYFEEIEYPVNLNITLENTYAKFYFLLGGDLQVNILEFEVIFHPRLFQDISPNTYYLSITVNLNYINVSFI